MKTQPLDDPEALSSLETSRGWRPKAVFLLGLVLFAASPIALTAWVADSLGRWWAIDLGLLWYTLAVPVFPLLRVFIEGPSRWRVGLFVPASWFVFDLAWDVSKGLCEWRPPLGAARAVVWRWALEHEVRRALVLTADAVLAVLPEVRCYRTA